MKPNTKKPLVIHPFLFAIFPVLSVFSHNVGELSLIELVAPTAVVFGFAVGMFLLLGFIIKDKIKAGILVSLFLLLFFSYELLFYSAYSIVGEKNTHGYVLPVWALLLISIGYLTITTRRNLRHLTILLNFAAAFSVVIPGARVGVFEAYYGLTLQDNGSAERRMETAHLPKSVNPPDIYYIILDAYARGDVLKHVYQYDNSEFLDHLAQKGFHVADKSRANYCQTYLSLASSLNLTYLDDLADRLGENSDNRRPLGEMIQYNQVVSFLKRHGYVCATFYSGGAIEIKNADVYLGAGSSLSEFQNVLIYRTPLPVLLEKLQVKSRYDSHRSRLLYIFDHLADMTKTESPVFVFAYIPVPHHPFVFGENGEPVKADEGFSVGDKGQFIAEGGDQYRESYKKQLIFVNKRMKEAIDRIISESPEPPIIIVQADHGPASMLDPDNQYNTDFKQRMPILNAYHLPGDGHQHLYDEITPVNTFRILFNHYFGANYELLKDESYFSTYCHPYALTNVTDQIDSDVYTQRSE